MRFTNGDVYLSALDALMNRVVPGPGPHVAPTRLLPHSPEAPGLARRHVRAALADRGVAAESLDDALLVVSELVTNAVQHALPPITLRLSCTRVRGRTTAVRIEVTDSGPAPRPDREADGPRRDENGRGNGIVAVLSERHGTRVLPDGIARWAEVGVRPLNGSGR